MAGARTGKPRQSIPNRGQADAERDPAALVEQAQAFARGLMFAKTVLTEPDDLEDVYLLLTNDIRALIEFDRAFLVFYLSGEGRCVATHGQTSLDKKSKLVGRINGLVPHLHTLEDTLILEAGRDVSNLAAKGLTKRALKSLSSYLASTDCRYVVCLPLRHGQATIALLMFEFFGDKPPDKLALTALGNVSPFLASALAERWILRENPSVARLIDPGSRLGRKGLRWLTIYPPLFIVLAAALWVVLFSIPFPFTVGGEAEIAPKERYVAFCNVDAIVRETHVSEGSLVEKGEVLAVLDPKDLDFKIGKARREYEILTKQMELLRNSVAEDLAKLAESELVGLKRRNKLIELQYLESQRPFLEIKAPVAGLVLTRDVGSLAGKSFRPGEPFCEIAAPGNLYADIYVPEDRIGYVERDQKADVYLNSNPMKGYPLVVTEISPNAQVVPRMGNVYRVRAPWPDAPSYARPGMKGIGKIRVAETSLWFIIKHRLIARWNQISLYLW